MLFVVVVEALHLMLDMANQSKLLTDFRIENSTLGVSHLQFGDDTVIFVMLSWKRLKL